MSLPDTPLLARGDPAASPGRFRVPPPQARPDLGPTLGRLGPLEVRLATTAKEVRSAQRLRFEVFHKEMSAGPTAASLRAGRDADAYDAICDHLLVLDHAGVPGSSGAREPKVVGTYRLLRQEVAERNFGFYSQAEFDIEPMIARHPGWRFLELGRSCVLKPYRDKRIVELLWHGIWTYVLHHRIDVMFGCASLEGTDPGRLALPLGFLRHFARAPEPWRAAPLPARRADFAVPPREAIDPRAAMRGLPPLLKGYLRLGARFGEGAVIDHVFGTTDVLVVLPVSAINARYIGHFGVDAGRHAERAEAAA